MTNMAVAEEAIRSMAEALGREPHDHFGQLAVHASPVGNVSHRQVRKIAVLGYRLGLLDRSGHVQAYIDRDGSVAGWRMKSTRRERRE